MITSCPICYNDFTWNPSAYDKTRLPVQSQQCPHLLCWGCLMELHSRAKRLEYAVVTLPCPECRAEDAYGPSNPIVSLAVCHALQERDGLLRTIQRQDRRHEQQRRGKPMSVQLLVEELWHEVLHPRHLLIMARREGLAPPENCTRIGVWMTRQAALAVLWGSSIVWGIRTGKGR